MHGVELSATNEEKCNSFLRYIIDSSAGLEQKVDDFS